MIRKTLPLLALSALLLGGCDRQATDTSVAPPDPSTDAAPAVDQPQADVPPATAAPEALASLRVHTPAEGTISFEGFGPARFGGTAEEVRMSWGGDLGDAQPSEPGGCHYLIPQPLDEDGYRVAFMIEADKFARMDVRTADVTAPGGGRIGMTGAEIQALYGGRVEERPHKYEADAKYLRVTDAAGGQGVLVFETDADGRVDEWRVGLPPQVDYVEGCS